MPTDAPTHTHTINDVEALHASDTPAIDHPASKRRKTGPEAHGRDALHGPLDGVDREADADLGMMQLETDEVLKETAVQVGREKALTALLNRLIRKLPKIHVSEVDPEPIQGFLDDLGFSLEVVGSHAIHAACRPAPCVDLAVEIPALCLDSKDQLNHRYHAKRALYLSHLVKRLAKQPGVAAVDWGRGLGGDARRPTLMVTLEAGTSPSGASIRILPVLPKAFFPLAKLGPDRNNLRSATTSGGEPAPTPQYNAGILMDMLMCEHAHAMKRVAAQVPRFASAVVLLKAWARQQCLSEGADGVSGFFLTALLMHLVQKGQTTPGMSAIHLFRATLQALSNPKPLLAGVAMKAAPGQTPSPPPPAPKAFRTPTKDTAVLIDPSGWLNIGGAISAAALDQTADAARRTAAVVPSGGPDAFDAAFFAQRPLASQFDLWYHVTVPHTVGDDGKALAGDVPVWKTEEGRVRALVAQALGDRATLLRAIGRALDDTEPETGAAGPAAPAVLVGVRVHPASVLRAIDQGPAADSGDAARAFRDFWGDRSELRRFVDGSIREAVVWECAIGEGHAIADRAVRHALQRHLPKGTVVTGTAALLDAALQRKDRTAAKDVEDERACHAAAERLGKKLRSLDTLALRIVTVQPLAAVLRHAATFPPSPHPLAGGHGGQEDATVPRCLEAIELLCQMEGSGRWPDGVEAYQKMKAAVAVQVAVALQQGYGLDAQAGEEWVDVLADGFAFRLRLGGERDEGMQRKELAQAGVPHPPPEMDIPLRVWHQGAVSAASAANPALQPALRLATRWVGAHLLSPHLRQETVELLVVAAFHQDAVAGPPPATRVAGFLRFLLLLAHHPWAVQPLVLGSATGELASGEHKEEAGSAHAALRAAGTAPAMFITGPDAAQCVGWSRAAPSASMLWRAVVLAERSAGVLQRALCDASTHASTALAALFSRDLDEYDVLVGLRQDAVPDGDRDLVAVHGRATLEGSIKVAPPGKHCRAILKGIPASVVHARGAAAVRKELLVGFHPVPLLVEALERRFGRVATFSADYCGGGVVGVKWLPQVLQPGPVVPEAAHALRPVVGEGQEGEGVVGEVVLDVDAVVEDIEEVGAGLVESITVVTAC